MLIQVISSWQVLAVTVVLVLYVFLINFVARIYRPSRRPRMRILPKSKPEGSEVLASSAETDDLGLEENTAPKKTQKKR